MPIETFGTQECPIYARERQTSGNRTFQELEGWKKHPPDKEELIQLQKDQSTENQINNLGGGEDSEVLYLDKIVVSKD